MRQQGPAVAADARRPYRLVALADHRAPGRVAAPGARAILPIAAVVVEAVADMTAPGASAVTDRARR